MTHDQWKHFVEGEVNKRASDKRDVRKWVEDQGFKVDSAGDIPGGWWLSAENKNVTFTKMSLRWDDNKTPKLEVSIG